jgi:hypothetical protein
MLNLYLTVTLTILIAKQNHFLDLKQNIYLGDIDTFFLDLLLASSKRFIS